MMSVLRTVVAREYLERVRTRTFLLSTLGLPLLMLALFGISAVMGARGGGGEFSVALVDRTGVLAEGLAPRLAAAGFQVEVVEPGSEGDLEPRLAAGDLDGVLLLDDAALERGAARWRGGSTPSTLRRLGMQQALTQSALAVRLRDSEDGAALAALLAGGGLEIEPLDPDDPDDIQRDAGMVAGFAGGFLLYVVLLVYGSMVLRAVLEEKTGRIVEIILASMKPSQLMLGKIVGVGAVGLTQLAIWIGLGALVLGTGITSALPFLPEGGLDLDLAAYVPSAGVLLFFAVCFLVGYFLYASLFAAVGAMCSTEEEAQQLQFPVVMLVIIPIIFLMPMMENPESGWAVALSLFPFFSPILMFARVAAGAAPAWEAALSVILMLGALFVTAWVAGRIYRTGVLMQGKRPTLPELWRWIRTG